MAAPLPLEVWLVTASQQVYGDEEMNTIAATSRQFAARLGSAEGMTLRIIPKQTVSTAGAGRALCLQANAATRCIGIVFWVRSFAPARMWVMSLSKLEKPLCFLHNETSRTMPRAPHQLRPAVVVGPHDDPATVAALCDWSRAAVGAHEARTLKIAGLGETPSGGESSQVGAPGFEQTGFPVQPLDTIELRSRLEGADERKIARLADQYHDLYEVAPELRSGEVRHGELRRQARLEIALGSSLAEGAFAGFTGAAIRGGGPTAFDISGMVVQRLMAAGYGFAPGGHHATAALVRVLKVMGSGPGGTTFLEDSTYARQTSGMAVFGPHMLEICPTVADLKTRPRIEASSVGGSVGVPRLVFAPATGPGVNSALTGTPGRPVVVANKVSVASPSEERSQVVTVALHPGSDALTASQCWAAAGAPRYGALTTNVPLHILQSWAGMMGIPFAAIEPHTSVRSFRKLLRGASHGTS